MAFTVDDGTEQPIVYVNVPEDLRREMAEVFDTALKAAEAHLLAAHKANEPLVHNFAAAVKDVSDAAKSLKETGQIPSVGGNSPGEDDVSNNGFSQALLSSYGFLQTPHKATNPHSIEGYKCLQPIANLMHQHCIYT